MSIKTHSSEVIFVRFLIIRESLNYDVYLSWMNHMTMHILFLSIVCMCWGHSKV